MPVEPEKGEQWTFPSRKWAFSEDIGGAAREQGHTCAARGLQSTQASRIADVKARSLHIQRSVDIFFSLFLFFCWREALVIIES